MLLKILIFLKFYNQITDLLDFQSLNIFSMNEIMEDPAS